MTENENPETDKSQAELWEDALKAMKSAPIQLVKPQDEPENSVEKITEQQIEGFGRLGREIKISPKSHISHNKPNFRVRYYVDTVSLLIGIGNDHTAELIMTKEAWNALKAGAPVQITTTKEYKQKFG